MKGRGKKLQPRCKNLGAKGSIEARHLEVAPAQVTRALGSAAQQPLPVPIPVSRVLSPAGCPVWDVGQKDLGLEWGSWGVHCRALEEGIWGHRDIAGGSWEETQGGNPRGCEGDL